MRKPIRLLWVVDSLSVIGGTENQLLELIRRTDPEHFKRYLICLEDSPRVQELRGSCEVAVWPVVSIYTWNGLRVLLRLRRFLRRENINVVHALLPRASILSILAARCPTHLSPVITSRRNLGEWFTPFYRRLFACLNRCTARILVNSEAVKETTLLLEGANARQIEVIYNGVDAAPMKNSGAVPETLRLLPPQTPVVGIVSNYRPVKDLRLFLHAAKLLASEFPSAVFLLIGQGPQYLELKQLASELGLDASRVIFTNGKGSVPGYLRHITVACLTSKSEGLSNAILEYMAAGLPVVAGDLSSNRELIEDGVSGFLAPSREPACFAGLIGSLLRDEALRTRIGTAAKRVAQSKFSMETMVRRHQDCYRQVAGFQNPSSTGAE